MRIRPSLVRRRLPDCVFALQSVDELLEIEGLDAERAGKLIMTARAPWFAQQQEIH